ncbi:hypothetical protein ppKF707_3018 [Metapseudomonas furukawaii]|uniref:Uncharacterized protein n=1 Tax=Metapseudomonas furukawaii TaxID=1149133 RepID=A0AAD1FFQ7_METFU|nr:hypothetical protein ppKF707_3018 [Pseudomonas furukawaii]BAU74442.1 hypothetical protein KF707C_27540 [Pseudomonas furukawaii]
MGFRIGYLAGRSRFGRRTESSPAPGWPFRPPSSPSDGRRARPGSRIHW